MHCGSGLAEGPELAELTAPGQMGQGISGLLVAQLGAELPCKPAQDKGNEGLHVVMCGALDSPSSGIESQTLALY